MENDIEDIDDTIAVLNEVASAMRDALIDGAAGPVGRQMADLALATTRLAHALRRLTRRRPVTTSSEGAR